MTAIDRVKASKRKAKAQRDNWKLKTLTIEAATVERIAAYAIERRGMFASDLAAKMFGDNLRAGYWKEGGNGPVA